MTYSNSQWDTGRTENNFALQNALIKGARPEPGTAGRQMHNCLLGNVRMWAEKTAYLEQNHKYTPLSSRNLSGSFPGSCKHRSFWKFVVIASYPACMLRSLQDGLQKSVGVSISMTNASSWTTMQWSRQYLSIICTEEHAVLIHAREVCSGEHLIPDSDPIPTSYTMSLYCL